MYSSNNFQTPGHILVFPFNSDLVAGRTRFPVTIFKRTLARVIIILFSTASDCQMGSAETSPDQPESGKHTIFFFFNLTGCGGVAQFQVICFKHAHASLFFHLTLQEVDISKRRRLLWTHKGNQAGGDHSEATKPTRPHKHSIIFLQFNRMQSAETRTKAIAFQACLSTSHQSS